MRTKTQKRKPSSVNKVSKQVDLELTEQELGRVTGGNTPQPSGPVPLPYPIVVKISP